jgi:hypothetical protein
MPQDYKQTLDIKKAAIKIAAFIFGYVVCLSYPQKIEV